MKYVLCGFVLGHAFSFMYAAAGREPSPLVGVQSFLERHAGSRYEHSPKTKYHVCPTVLEISGRTSSNLCIVTGTHANKSASIHFLSTAVALHCSSSSQLSDSAECFQGFPELVDCVVWMLSETVRQNNKYVRDGMWEFNFKRTDSGITVTYSSLPREVKPAERSAEEATASSLLRRFTAEDSCMAGQGGSQTKDNIGFNETWDDCDVL